MKQIRYKKKYLTGDTKIDKHHIELTQILNNIVTDASKIEHCQDLNELHQCLSSSAETLFKTAHTDSRLAHTKVIAEIVSTHLPLSAKNGTACCHCNLCDRIEQQMNEWLHTSN